MMARLFAVVGEVGRTVSERTYRVYITTNQSRTLSTGVAGNLARRLYEHRHLLDSGFAARYRIDQLVYAEPFSDFRGSRRDCPGETDQGLAPCAQGGIHR